MKRINNLVQILAILALASFAHAQPQPPDTSWTKTFGGPNLDYCFCALPATDGGFFVSGYVNLYLDSDLYYVKTDANGDTIWTRTFDVRDDDRSFQAVQTADGGYVAVGFTGFWPSTTYDALLIKLDDGGNLEWLQTIDLASTNNKAWGIQQTEDGGFIIAGEAGWGNQLDALLLKTDAYGEMEWYRTYGGYLIDGAERVKQTEDNGYILFAHTWSFGAGDCDFYLIKTDSLGNEQWHRTYGGSAEDWGRDGLQTPDGGYIFVGSTMSIGAGARDVWLIRTDVNGDTVWTRTYGGNDYDAAYSIEHTVDAGYIIGGRTRSQSVGENDFWIIKTDDVGNIQWDQTFGGIYDDRGRDIQQTLDGGYIFVGETASFGPGQDDIWLLRLESEIPSPQTITLIPINPPIIIPANGGGFDFNVLLENSELNPVTFDTWIMVQLPDLSWFGPVLGPVNLTLPGMTTIDRDRTQSVPAGAPSGIYTYEGRVGIYPDDVWHSNSFTFEKLETGDGVPVYNWANTGESFDLWLTESSSEIPSEFQLFDVFPNPFNPSTTISFSLPEASIVNLAVYDVSGRLVATLINGWRDAGMHEVTWDASGLASGVYIYHLSTGNVMASEKMVLIK